jgi:LmbE family N-acetylglucosaminyl deacetylase
MTRSVTVLVAALATAACTAPEAADEIPPWTLAVPVRDTTAVDVFVSAHEDDDLLFMNPDIADAIANDHEVTVAYTTAGDLAAPRRDGYWIDRERGILEAYSFMLAGISATAYTADLATLPPGWTASIVDLAGLHVAQYTRDHVTLVFLRLSDFQEQCLWEQTTGCSQLNPTTAPPYQAFTRTCPGNAPGCPGGTTLAGQQVTRDELIDALAALLARTGASTLHALDASGLHTDGFGLAAYTGKEAGYLDYADHVFSARFALAAASRVPNPPTVKLYRGYTLSRTHSDLADDVAIAKQDVFARYAIFDTDIVATPTPATFFFDVDDHVEGEYRISARGSWQRRQAATTTIAPTRGTLATATGTCLGADLAATLCTGAPAWLVTAEHTLQLAGTGSCIAVTAGVSGAGTARPEVTLAPCAAAGTTVFAFDNGQLHVDGDTCLTLEAEDALTARPCAARIAHDHVADAPVAAQAFVVAP